MLRVEKINQFYGQSHILWDLDLNVKQGQCTVLMGRNGVGKTTLLKCIMGELSLSSGAILFEDEDISSLNTESRPRKGIGYVPQGRQIFPLLTVEENLQIGLPVLARGERKIADYIFDLFPVLKDMLARRGVDLSGRQQQQLAIARALVVKPKLLILDEPTEGIQPNIVQEIGDIIVKLNEQLGLTVLLVEQKLPFARRVGDQFCILDRGCAIAQGDIKDLNDNLIQQYLTV